MSINENANNIIDQFTSHQQWEDRYKVLIKLGKELEQMPEDYLIDDNKVKGCQSQVWLYATLEGEKIKFYGTSDAAIAKGIVALLISVYSDCSPSEILTFSDEFIDKIGLKQHLSMSRANGLASMMKQIKLYALAYQAKLGQ